MKQKVELLSPAGNYEAFIGALNAGADAVYLGGDRFGARAYADNFTAGEICRALHVAHFMGRKIYLTVNTLAKEQELETLCDWLAPFYEAGLDGVIVQDIGVLCRIRECFPDLALHASTQMALTGVRGAAFLKRHGVSRLVPARELSLAEIRGIKAETGMEVECFIHGAMCYSYSGQCLFSSILGGRSGNRGRCAQPCRLPYRICEDGVGIGDAEYPLSLKDMCTIACLPRLIEAGIDSFKIEGRMKKPEYAAGVTAIYRKYIDLYEASGAAAYRVEPADMDRLRGLYIRSEVQDGYYERHNGREMVTLRRPGYTGSSPEVLEEIRAHYLREPEKRNVRMQAVLCAGQEAFLEISDADGLRVSVYGDRVEPAKNRPLQREEAARQLVKTGGELVRAENCSVEIQGEVFLPVSAINGLRRKGVEAYERQYIASQGMTASRRQPLCGPFARPTGSVNGRTDETLSRRRSAVKETAHENNKAAVDILVTSYEQLEAAAAFPCQRIYIESDLFLAEWERVTACMRKNSDREYYLALPYILRARDADYLDRLAGRADTSAVSGFLLRNYEAAAYVGELGRAYALVPDAGLYVWNSGALRFWAQYASEYTLPYELNARECAALVSRAGKLCMSSSLIVYGRIPMMVSAGCVRRTAGRCVAEAADGTTGKPVMLRDRYGTDFPVETNCVHCYNIIYNSVPYSLHGKREEACRVGADRQRYDFTAESGEECRRILAGGDFPWEKYTTGHFRRGVE